MKRASTLTLKQNQRKEHDDLQKLWKRSIRNNELVKNRKMLDMRESSSIGVTNMIDEEKKRLIRLLDKTKSQIETLLSVLNRKEPEVKE